MLEGEYTVLRGPSVCTSVHPSICYLLLFAWKGVGGGVVSDKHCLLAISCSLSFVVAFAVWLMFVPLKKG